ncbi:hypothetical protein, partial [Chromohalobacter israelensis]|uniref:hypothetical protein n=1 Tax=Chromohalobacter israelensis TaxID=141390 RepID=UPI001C641B7E
MKNESIYIRRQDAIRLGLRFYIGGHCKHCKQKKTIRYTVNSCCVNCNGKRKGALRRWVWNSPPELGQNMTSTAAGGMTWTAPR